MDFQMQFGTSWQQKFYHLDGFGCIGVDLFFVISGFIITYVANKYKGFDEGMRFLEKRFWRINPVYYIATILCLGVYLLQLKINNTPFPNKAITSLMDTVLLLPTSSDIINYSPLLIVGWTLSFEWFFYLLFFALILGNIKRKTIYLPTLILFLIGIGLLLKPDDLRLQFITNPIMLEFVLGVIICQLYLNNIKIPTWVAAATLAVGLISYGLLIRFGYGDVWYYLNTINGQASLHKFLIWGIPSSAIVFGCIFLEKNGYLTRLFGNRLSVLLGNASYSIYLIHYITLNILTIVYIKTHFFWRGDVMIWLQLIVATVIAIGFYKLVEKPLIKRLQQKKKTKSNNNKEQTILPMPEPVP
jgi:peptidoglycan/LPS O-acetylase OafA/YrhL